MATDNGGNKSKAKFGTRMAGLDANKNVIDSGTQVAEHDLLWLDLAQVCVQRHVLQDLRLLGCACATPQLGPRLNLPLTVCARGGQRVT